MVQQTMPLQINTVANNDAIVFTGASGTYTFKYNDNDSDFDFENMRTFTHVKTATRAL